MYQQRKANIGVVRAANASVVQSNPSHSTNTSKPAVRSAALDWMCPRAFKARYDAQPGVDRDLASDTRMPAEAIAGLLVDHVVVPTQDVLTTTELAIGVEL